VTPSSGREKILKNLTFYSRRSQLIISNDLAQLIILPNCSFFAATPSRACLDLQHAGVPAVAARGAAGR
jgi:hypothetical protein